MNRQIKFRVWDKKAKKFLFQKDDLHLWEGEWNYPVLICSIGNEGNYFTCPDSTTKAQYHVIQQFTGFKDIDGNEIYDGDLILGDNYGPYRVFWDNNIGGWRSCCSSDSELIARYRSIKVVGHIFDGKKYKGVQ